MRPAAATRHWCESRRRKCKIEQIARVIYARGAPLWRTVLYCRSERAHFSANAIFLRKRVKSRLIARTIG